MTVQTTDLILASILTSYPDEAFKEDVTTMLAVADTTLPLSLDGKVRAIVEEDTKLDELRSEYLELFDSGRGVAPLYETEYGRQRVFFKANELSDIAGFYRAFGFELGGEEMSREMPDHLSVELEFYSLLRLKQEHLEAEGNHEGAAIVLDARKKFLVRHLGRFVPSILSRPGIAASATYREILLHCDELIKAECELLDVVPEKADWVEGENETEEVSCGGG